MNLLADEGIDAPIVNILRKDGHNVSYVAESDSGITDEEIINKAYKEKRLLITQDKDFGGLVYRQKKPHHGIMLIRLQGFKPKKKAELISDAIRNHEKKLFKRFSVIQKDSIRIRGNKDEPPNR